MSSIDYYNKNATAFHDRTVDTDMSVYYERFLRYLPENASILDAGCGVGRDAKAFAALGHTLTAFDGSMEMVKLASEALGKDVMHMRFQDIDFSQEYDGVWACASLLHVPYNELKEVFQKLHRALKPSGTLYASFKYGNELREVEGRNFSDMDEKNIPLYLDGLFEPMEVWKSNDTGSKVTASPHKAWLNVICRPIYDLSR